MSRPRSSLGAMLLRFRQKYGPGLRTAYYRERVRPRILATPPVECGGDQHCEVHVLTSESDFLNLVWALKSFYHYAGRKYPLCIHDDGTLRPESAAALMEHFAGARLITRVQANDEVDAALRSYPRCQEFRRTNHLAPKVFDFVHYLACDRLLLIDSDVLFFEFPRELISRAENPQYRLNSVNADVSSAYTVNPHEVSRRCGFDLQPQFNSGLGVIHRASLRLEWIEEFLALPGIIGHFWRIEQTLYALCSSKFGVELLPAQYAVRLDRGVLDGPCRHYVGAIRQLMYGEGIRRLVKQGFLEHV